ncbi:DUF6907 domain-containing protein [Streptomyces canus]
MQDTVQTVPAAFASPRPAVSEDRTLTYRLRGGGSMTHPCPDWCVYDHAWDLEHGVHPAELYHQGKEVSLTLKTAEDDRDVILAARIAQYPFAESEGHDPYMTLMPVSDNGEDLGYLHPADVAREIARVRDHLRSLEELNEQLIGLRAASHAAQGGEGGWFTLRPDDIRTMPVSYLLTVFGVTVSEVDDDSRPAGELAVLSGKPGTMRLSFMRCVTQTLREQLTRDALLGFLAGGAL